MRHERERLATRRVAEGSAGASPDPPTIAQRINELRRLEAEDPDGHWFLPLGGALRDGGRFLEAVQVIRRGLARKADSLSGWVVLGQCYLALNEMQAARRVLESALRRDPENASVLRCLAILHARQGRRTDAAGYYRTLIKLVPFDLAAQEALATLLEPAEDGAFAVDGERAALPRISAEQEDPVPDAEAERAAASGRVGRFDPRRRRPEVPRPPRGTARILPPEPRPDTGIFEPPPHDLDWDEPVSHRAADKGKRSAASRRVLPSGGGSDAAMAAPKRRTRTPSAPASRKARADGSARGSRSSPAASAPPGERTGKRASALSGYRRWLERLMTEEGQARSPGPSRPGPESDPTAGNEMGDG